MSDETATLHLVKPTNGVASPPLVGGDGQPQVRAFLGQSAQEHHIVQFYDDERFLCENVAHFLAGGLTVGEPVIVIATPSHREAFSARLKLHGCDVEQALARGQLTLLDARETLALFMVGETPDWERFQNVIGGAIEKSRNGTPQRRVRAYGEMVDLLWRDGNKQGAVSLEQLWNELGTLHSFSLLCAYVMGNFYRAADGLQFQEVCAAHTHVIPTEKITQARDAESRLRAAAELEQRARSLENEIAQRKELEGALRQALAREMAARQEAERNVRFNEMFAGMLGHDLRNPLGAIVMGASYISRIDSGEKATKAATRILSSAERMSRMIDQLLDFTRIRVGDKIALNRTGFDLNDLCYRIKDEIEAGNPECIVQVETVGTALGLWDYDRLQQVFSNLVGNAIHHGSSGCTVSIRTDGSDAAGVVVFVHNHGAVPPEILPVIFEPFRGSKLNKTRGLGLGLYITRQIVLAHGGAIEAVSNEHDGTTMRVELPRTSK